MTERSGIEIDYCPQCRGVWLDKGELDKIIERSGQISSRPASHEETRQAPQNAPHEKYFSKHESKHEGHGHHDDKYGKHGKKKSWLGDIFDL
jgi:Zn-finger nucleic acid-binding protein